MRIALVVRGGFHPSGRDEVIPALLWLVERLARRHDVHVFALRHLAQPGRYPLLGATVHDLGGAGATGWAALRVLRRLTKGLGGVAPDVIHAYMGSEPGALAALAGRMLRVPVLVTLDGNELVRLPEIGYGLELGRRGRLLLALATRLASRLTVCSGYMEGLARSRGLAVERVPLGVDLRLFAPAPAPPGPPWRLLHVAHLNPVKDQATLLEALRRVVDREPAVHLDIVGRDTLDGAVQARAAALDLARHVTFHGLRPVDELPAFYRGCHLLVQSSRHEAAAVAVLEAAACGRPAVGTAVGYVADGAAERAVATPAGDPGALAGAVLALLRDEPRRDRIAAAAARWARAHDADWSAARFEEIYGRLVRPPRA